MGFKLKTLAGLAALGFAAYAAYADNVQISTYYPSPYGSYATLNVTTGLQVGAGALGANALAVTGTTALTGNTTITGNSIVTGTSSVTGNTTLSGTATIGASAPAGTKLTVSNGNANIQGTLNLTYGGQNGTLQATCSAGTCYAMAVYS
jgi:hypothetical protein